MFSRSQSCRGNSQSPVVWIAEGIERSSRQGRSLAGCKSPHRQLPVFGRLAYPMRGEVEGRPLGLGLQDQGPNHRKLRRHNGRGGVVSRRRESAMLYER